ncbi:glycoside hydrolase superfamily [Mucidula mucida]|nr:glycoside hydrolase superfamily [Mucidula mucida]
MDRFKSKILGGFQKTINSIEREFDSFTGSNSAPQVLLPLDLSNPSTYYRYRKQRGVNLGAWFVLERWIVEAPYREARDPGQSDLDVAKGSNAKQILEQHWDTWITEPDWEYLASKCINTVRIPIGYYHLCGADPSVLEKTHFKDMHSVFAGAWPRIVNAIQTALRYGIGVLLDLHAAPGKQNHDSHGGTSKEPEFFNSSRHRDHTIHVLLTLIRLLNNAYPNIVGIELLNEPAPPSDTLLKDWYSEATKAISALDPTIPLYLGECWQTDNYAEYIKSAQGHTPNMLVLDHHLYRCFTGEDIQTSAHDHAGALRDPNNGIVQTLGRVGNSLVHRVFANAQLELFEREGWDNGWSFRDVQLSEVLPAGLGAYADTGCAARSKSSAWWDQHPGQYNHERFGQGFAIGWDDSYAFFRSIGFKTEWARRRSGDGYWEFGTVNGSKKKR